MTYTDFPDVPEFGDATIYYPLDTPESIGGVAIAPGYTERQSHIEWWGPRLASHGYAVLVLDTNDRRNRPDLRADALIAAVITLRAENTRSGSPSLGQDRRRKNGDHGPFYGRGRHPDRSARTR